MSASKQKGTAWETAVVRYMQAHGLPGATRVVLHGNKDHGDILIERFSVECKNEKRIALSSYIDEAIVQARNAGVERHAVVVKRPRKGDPADAYAVMNLAQFTEIVRELYELRVYRRGDTSKRGADVPPF